MIIFSAAVLTAYTVNCQDTTLALGKKYTPIRPLIGQGAFTPKSQSLRNVTVVVLLVTVLLLGFMVYEWYIAVILLGITFLAASVLKRLFPKPGSEHYIEMIRSHLKVSYEEYLRKGDALRADATLHHLNRLDDVVVEAFGKSEAT